MPNTTARLFQISTSAALVQGVLHGACPSKTALENGDFGIGTFAYLDGEMVILDGEVFQICEDGTARRRLDNMDLPFAQVCHFISPQTCSFRDIADLESLKEACNACRLSENLFFAFRINATFQTMHARTVKATEDGSSLESAGNNEVKFTWHNISGSLLGFWSPAFASSFSVPGYHFHFISDDRVNGGHVLDCSFVRASSHVQVLNVYEVALPQSGTFLETDLSVDARAVLQKVE